MSEFNKIEELYEQQKKLAKKRTELKEQLYNLRTKQLEIEQNELKLLLKRNELIKEMRENGGKQRAEELLQKKAHFDPDFVIQ